MSKIVQFFTRPRRIRVGDRVTTVYGRKGEIVNVSPEVNLAGVLVDGARKAGAYHYTALVFERRGW